MSRFAPLKTLTIAACAALAAAWIAAGAPRLAAQAPSPVPADPSLLSMFHWRSVGPDRGGRSIAVSGVKGRPREGYFGATGGGLWKTTDAGETWAPVTDGQIKSSSVGAVAVAESNPDVVFIGMGESCIRGNIEPGDGVYRSTDAGKTWTHVGFDDSQAISKIRIHPTNADVVFVASFGKYGAPSENRGVFKSTDGGQTWRKVLYRDAKTGAVDVIFDRNNPTVMYAALWEAYRLEYQMSSGGPGSGLFKSTDGGEHWTEITRTPGLPSGMIGKIGISVSGADSNRVYALVENENGGLFMSDDAGATWTLQTANRNVRQRAFYFTHVFADPKTKDTVYLLNVQSYKSTDAGKTIPGLGGGTHSDFHDMWIDPDDPQHILIANDGGGAVSTNGGQAWTAEDFPTAQYYHVVATAHVPYHLCGAQQDGSTVCLPSTTNLAPAGLAGRGGGGRAGGGGAGGRGGGAAPLLYSPGGAEPAYIAADPRDPDIFFAGGNNGSFLQYTNRRTGENREVHPYPRMFSGEAAAALVERVQWTFPIIYSPVDPRVLYTATQHVWKTTTGGQTWDRISGDLTRHDPKTMGDSGGPITHDMNGPEVYATVFALGPGKTDVNVLWAGSDDGVIQVTRDGGKNWSNVTPREMPEFGRVSIVDASSFDAGTAYAAVKKPLLDDFAPYIFRTHDFGRTWTKIVTGLGAREYVHTVREDPRRRGLLYAGTQHGIYYSYDDGDHWHSLSLNLPDVQVSDVIVTGNDLAISTMGRSFYILDNVGPLRQFSAEMQSANVYLFKPNDAIRNAGGAAIQYWVKQAPQSLKLEVIDPRGTVVRTFESPASAAGAVEAAGGRGGAGTAPGGVATGPGGAGGGRGGGRGGAGAGPGVAQIAAGFNTVNWDLRYPGATSFPGMILWGGSTAGPLASPGTYQVRMTVDGRTQTQSFLVKRHPLWTATDTDLQEQFDLAIQIRDKTTEANNAVIQIRTVKTQVADRLGKSQDDRLKTAGDTLVKNLSAIEEEIYQVRNQSGQDPLNFPIKINNRLASLLGTVNDGDGKPIGNALPIFNDLKKELKVQTDKLIETLQGNLAVFNQELRRLGLDAVSDK